MKQKNQLSFKLSSKARTAIRRDGTQIPVLDGKFDFLIEPTEDDIKNGIPGDPENCMYARACRRLYNGLVWITRSLAYLELNGKGGKPELRRFMLKQVARNNIKGFDQGDEFTNEAVIFARPKGREKLDSKRNYTPEDMARWRDTRKAKRGKAYVKGTKPVMEPLFAKLRPPATGKFQFQKTIEQLRLGA